MNETWKVLDMNGHLNPPLGYTLTGVDAIGGYLVVSYWRERFGSVAVYLNSDGREVLRTIYERNEPSFQSEPPPVRRTAWEAIKWFFTGE